MSSPICTVNGSTTGNGVNVASGSTVTIQIYDTAGVNAWSIKCLTTDDLQVAASITASLTIDAITKTATFTAPTTTVGAAMIFESKINGGLDINGRNDASLTTRFGVFVLTASGNLRVGAFDETVEGNAAFGWTAKFNAGIRSAAAAGVTPTVTGSLPIVIDNSNPAALVASINPATTSLPGSLSASDKTKLNTLKPIAPTSPIAITDVFGTNFISINPANGAAAGSMSSADKTKVDDATASATADKLAMRNGSGGCSFAALGATTVTASSGFIGPYIASPGANISTTGLVRGSNSQVLVSGRNDGGSDDVRCLSFGVEFTDYVEIGSSAFANGISLATSASGNIVMLTNNISLFALGSYGGGEFMVYIANARTLPSSNPSDGGYLFADNGALKWRGSAGTVTTLAPA